MTEEKETLRSKTGKAGYYLTLFGVLCVLGFALFLGLTLFGWLSAPAGGDTEAVEALHVQPEELSGEGTAPAEEATAWTMPQEGTQKPVYTQAQVDELVAKAREEAAVAARQAMVADIQLQLENGSTIVEALRKCFADRLVMASGGKYYFLPIRSDLAHNKYESEKLQLTESGELQYVENDQVVSHKGIDVSKFQGKIDWKKVAADGVEFAIIRVGYRGYGGSGKLAVDDTFKENLKGAKAAGLKTGVYIYSQAINDEEVLAEAELVLSQIRDFDVKGPIVFDVEKVAGANGRMNELSVEERTRLTKLFCETIKKAGHYPMVYHNMEMGLIMLDLAELKEYDKWFAYYNTDLYYPYDYDIWQYTDKGRVNGIGGDVDLNICFKLWDE